jgi:hypothetical protein
MWLALPTTPTQRVEGAPWHTPNPQFKAVFEHSLLIGPSIIALVCGTAVSASIVHRSVRLQRLFPMGI